jgi:hypothetical protein
VIRDFGRDVLLLYVARSHVPCLLRESVRLFFLIPGSAGLRPPSVEAEGQKDLERVATAGDEKKALQAVITKGTFVHAKQCSSLLLPSSMFGPNRQARGKNVVQGGLPLLQEVRGSKGTNQERVKGYPAANFGCSPPMFWFSPPSFCICY